LSAPATRLDPCYRTRRHAVFTTRPRPRHRSTSTELSCRSPRVRSTTSGHLSTSDRPRARRRCDLPVPADRCSGKCSAPPVPTDSRARKRSSLPVRAVRCTPKRSRLPFPADCRARRRSSLLVPIDVCTSSCSRLPFPIGHCVRRRSGPPFAADVCLSSRSNPSVPPDLRARRRSGPLVPTGRPARRRSSLPVTTDCHARRRSSLPLADDPPMRFDDPPAFEATGSDLHRSYQLRLCSAFRLSQPLDALLRPQPFRLCFMPVTLMGFTPSEVCSPPVAGPASPRARPKASACHDEPSPSCRFGGCSRRRPEGRRRPLYCSRRRPEGR
jgi:hypothetical protein